MREFFESMLGQSEYTDVAMATAIGLCALVAQFVIIRTVRAAFAKPKPPSHSSLGNRLLDLANVPNVTAHWFVTSNGVLKHGEVAIDTRSFDVEIDDVSVLDELNRDDKRALKEAAKRIVAALSKEAADKKAALEAAARRERENIVATLTARVLRKEEKAAPMDGGVKNEACSAAPLPPKAQTSNVPALGAPVLKNQYLPPNRNGDQFPAAMTYPSPRGNGRPVAVAVGMSVRR